MKLELDGEAAGLGGEALWDAKDVARYCKVSRNWVYLQADKGAIPSVRLGGLVRFVPSAVRAWAHGAANTAAQVVAFRPGR